MADARTILIPGNGTGSLSFELPPGVTMDVEAVLVNVDATGAASPVTAELQVAEQSGVVIAAKPQGSTIANGTSAKATWALRLDDSGASVDTTGFLKWGANTDAASAGLTLTGHGAFSFTTGGNSFSTTTSNGAYSVSAGNGGISFDTSAPGTFDAAVHNSDFKIHSSNASIGTSGSGTQLNASGVNVAVGASSGISIDCTGGDVSVLSNIGHIYLDAATAINIRSAGGSPLLTITP